jgi:multiple sugar transport system permease protein
MKTKTKLYNAAHVTVLVALSLSFLFPLYWMLITSLKLEHENSLWPPTMWPQKFTLENYESILSHPEDTPLFSWFKNSLIAATSYSILSVTISLLAGYALARMTFRGKSLYLTLLLIAMTIPGIILIIPSFIVVDFLGWTNSLKAIIFPALSGPFGVLLFYQFLSKFPKDLEEAAVIDGASSLRILISVIIPHTKPIILTLLILNFMGNWNDYFWPFITLYSPGMRTMPVGMATLQGRFEHFYGAMTAGAVLMAIPSIILFVLIQKYYIKAITLTGAIKE